MCFWGTRYLNYFLILGSPDFPKGPFRTKNTTTIVKIVNYYAVVFLLRPPNLVRRGPFFERKNVCNSQENGVRTRCAAIVNQPAVLKILRVVNLLRVVFLVRRGPLGSGRGVFFRAACLQNEIAPKSFNFKTKNGPKNDPKLPRNILSLVLLCIISHRHYSKIFHREFPHKIKYLFTTRICRHGHAKYFLAFFVEIPGRAISGLCGRSGRSERKTELQQSWCATTCCRVICLWAATSPQDSPCLASAIILDACDRLARLQGPSPQNN